MYNNEYEPALIFGTHASPNEITGEYIPCYPKLYPASGERMGTR